VSGTWVRMGTVKSVNPARRELRIDPTKRFEKGAKDLEAVRVFLGQDQPLLCRVDAISANPAGLIVTLGAGISRDQVARMKNAVVDAPPLKRARATAETMAASEWIGLEVLGVDGARIGRIAGCIESPAHDILEIDAPDGQQLLLPAIEQTVESIDLDAGRVLVRDIRPYVISNAD